MNKVRFFALLLVMCLVVSCTTAEGFNVREGIRWGMSYDEVFEALKKQNHSEYTYVDITENVGYDRTYVWVTRFSNIKLGNSSNTKIVIYGTQKYGLARFLYVSNFDDKSYDNVQSEFVSLNAQLQAKYGYGLFSIVDDKRKSYKSVKKNNYVVKSEAMIKDATTIRLGLVALGDEEYCIEILYTSQTWKNIYDSIEDGTYTEDVSYGL